jgi:hypothetical protein
MVSAYVIGSALAADVIAMSARHDAISSRAALCILLSIGQFQGDHGPASITPQSGATKLRLFTDILSHKKKEDVCNRRPSMAAWPLIVSVPGFTGL